SVLLRSPVFTILGLIAVLAVKTSAAALAFRVLRLNWATAFAMGLGLSQLGELSFILLSQGVSYNLMDVETYQRMLFIALTSIILTPMFLKFALSRTSNELINDTEEHNIKLLEARNAQEKVIVVGVGPIGSRTASYLELSGFDVCLIDMNPVNLHPYAQQGFRTVAGDATDHSILALATVTKTKLVVITLPSDNIAEEVIESVRDLNVNCTIVVRCHFAANMRPMLKLGADKVVCEELETGFGMLETLENLVENVNNTEIS
ncbi:MAG: NAD-binding protein, partial [Thermoguttaceae bacterium]